MNKWIKRLFILILVFIVLAVAGVLALKVYRLDKKELYAEETAILPGIVCIGDSLTHGTGGENVSYPFYLSEMLEKEGYVIPVFNLGVGGENSVTIAERLGGMPFAIDSVTIPADNTPVEIQFLDYKDFRITPLRQGSPNNSGINPCSIAGIDGTITIEQESFSSEEFKYYFTRESDGEEVDIPSGEVINTYASYAYDDCIQIIFMGSNGGYESEQELIDECNSIIDSQNCSDRYLIIGLTVGSRDENAPLEEAFQIEYGSKYINLREYMCDEAILKGVGVTITDADLGELEQGIVPECIRADDIHYTEAGYRLLASIVYDRIMELGYLSELDSIASSYNKKWKLLHSLEVTIR